jgi:hypothetical protein
MKKRRKSKALENAARGIKDSDDFVAHVFSIAQGFAAHHELDAGAGTRGVRQSLRAFGKYASGLVEWLERSATQGSSEHEALSRIGKTLRESGTPPGDAVAVRVWLEHAAQASTAADVQLQGRKLKNAPRFAAQALRATFEHHKLKVSHRVTAKAQSDAVKLLCAIARDGGDASMTPAQAKEWLIESASK